MDIDWKGLAVGNAAMGAVKGALGAFGIRINFKKLPGRKRARRGPMGSKLPGRVKARR